jgi:hypothetical protein
MNFLKECGSDCLPRFPTSTTTKVVCKVPFDYSEAFCVAIPSSKVVGRGMNMVYL